MKWLTLLQKTVLYAASERDSGQCGEIGRHAGFKIRFLQGSGGSTPPTGTKF